MTTWRMLSDERTTLYSPIGLRLVDEMTGQAPVGRVTPVLELSDGSGGWRKTDVKAVLTLNGVIEYPGLERRVEVPGQLPRRYRIRLNAEFYRPMNSAGFEFDAYPYNDSNPPNVIAGCGFRMMSVSNDIEREERVQEFQSEFESKKKECAVLIVNSTSDPDKWTIAGFNDEEEFKSLLIVDPNSELSVELKKGPTNARKIVELVTSNLGRTLIASQVQDAFLIPATNYPFPTHISILRGAVKDALGKVVESVKVIHDHFDPNTKKHWVQRVLTDERGEYALPLRRVQKNVAIAINADDPTTDRVGSINVTIPADLGKNHTIILRGSSHA